MWFESYLFNRWHYVKLDGTPSTFESNVTGVPQGSILGPSSLINDLPLLLKNCHILLYADDTALFISDRNPKIHNE